MNAFYPQDETRSHSRRIWGMDMKRFTCAAVLACTLVATSAVADPGPVSGTVGPHGSVLIDARTPDYGYTVQLSVIAWDRSDVSVDQTQERGDTSQVRAVISRDGTTTKIVPAGGPLRKKVFFGLLSWGSWASVRWIVHVPRNAPLTAYADNSGIKVDGVTAPVVVRTSNGAITVAGAGPQVDAATSNGAIGVKIASLGGHVPDIHIQTSNGGVTLTVPNGFTTRVSARTSNGGIENPFADAGGPGSAAIDTSNGGITVRTQP